MKKKDTIDIITLGCSKNLVDSEFLMRQFEALGYRVRHDAEVPDGNIVIVNTCGFIADAKEESIYTILQFAKQRKENKIDKLFVMGCLSQRYLKELQEEIPEVDKFYGKFDYVGILKELGENYQSHLRLERTLTTPAHYAYVKIAEGCNRTCSYCAIPLMTGKYQSRPMEDIEKEVKILVSKGVKELQLIAQDLSDYGEDLYKTSKLAELIERLSDIQGVEWIRLHYAYPVRFPFDVLKVMRERDNVCKYLDISFQHISDKMLKLMRRNITKKQTYELIDRIREEVPGIHLRTTLMVGHPGETEEDIQELKEFIRKEKFERLGAFTYSHEEGTFAYQNYEDEISEEEKLQRLDEIMELQQQISFELNQFKIGKVFKVMIDRVEGEYYVGRTEFDSPEVDPEVLIPISNKNIKIGEFSNVKIIDALDFDLYGTSIVD
ncbi:MAG TPA: 30S ribosomal protein S12 methylthiotransferase RimO [Paludibacteraceae bacterium]|nr:30S ribosomal protein S12 methylthiotransferase RimO [Paludibacteraceae bacterium]HOK36744.1 30S ribosomal protein S12 methylthiotransferase RimO [Paludibacteraceae bacterium]HOL00223.1 30S ribosomal protein S12 methylthiotransferase RimO [Paludibacteraceae bacterium]HPO66820.1 30S ribosomal protein S12 methylthiotransferase RimO [Paludibacteraceae bacterium]